MRQSCPTARPVVVTAPLCSTRAGSNNEAKRLAVALGIKALPTFHFYRGNAHIDTMTGAKVRRRKGAVCVAVTREWPSVPA
jgi:hypothetical protein